MEPLNLFDNSVDIFVSIHPQYTERILEGEKTVELRRRFPNLNGSEGRLLIYSTTPVKSVMGYAEIEKVHYLPIEDLWAAFRNDAKIQEVTFWNYFKGLTHGYGVQLKNPIRFPTPLSIDYLKQNYGVIAPQSYRYLNQEHEVLFSAESTKNEDAAGH